MFTVTVWKVVGIRHAEHHVAGAVRKSSVVVFGFTVGVTVNGVVTDLDPVGKLRMGKIADIEQ